MEDDGCHSTIEDRGDTLADLRVSAALMAASSD